MRRTFFKELEKQMELNPDIWVLTGDLGYGGFDKIRDELSNRFINCGASEFSMVGIAAGLALEGKIPFCYTITSFYYRAFEMIRTYINHEKIPVVLIGSGRDQDYAHDGYSHNATDIPDHFALLDNIRQYYPTDKKYIERILNDVVKGKRPVFISLQR